MLVITYDRFLFAGGVFRVFGRDSNNCNFDSSVKNTNMPQFFLFGLSYSYDQHNIFNFANLEFSVCARSSSLSCVDPRGFKCFEI